MRNLVQRAFVAHVGFALVVAAIVGEAYAGDIHGYRTGTIVESNKNECAGVPACLSTTSPGVTVPARGRKAERFACPTSHPNLWAWDAAQHEHVLVQLVAVDQWTATIEGVNAADMAGGYVISLGCSTAPYAGSGIQKSRQLAPTALLPARRQFAPPLRPSPVPVGSGDRCDNVPFCQLQQQTPFLMSGWETTTQSYQCKSPFPYAWGLTWTQTGRPSVSAIGEIAAVYPSTLNVLLTNWNLFATDEVAVTLACSKSNSFGGTCGTPQRDPGCPVVAGSTKNHCSAGPVPVCFQNYEERCAPNNQLFSCTIDLLVSWCSPCPG